MKRSIGLLLLAPAMVWSQAGMETGSGTKSPYPLEWAPGPSRDSVPSWAGPGKIRFARWDGGPMETAKAMMSGWAGFNPANPDLLYAMTNWYDPHTVSLLKEANLNLVWVTFSVGFSKQTEKAQQQQVKRYIEECHRNGIRVMAYESIGNMFWEDMFEAHPESREWVRIGKDGKPTPYGAGDYAKAGRITRYMAQLDNPAWRSYLKKRIDLAVDAGADGIMYDNNFGDSLYQLYRELYEYARTRKKDLLLMGNFHADTYVLNRLLNCITTEDGFEPGIYGSDGLANPRVRPLVKWMREAPGGRLMNNIGLMRVHESLAAGWKPVMIEDGHREIGDRLTTPMSARRHQLALAEAMSFGVGMELFVEGRFAWRLSVREPEVMNIWRAIGDYNGFFQQNPSLYTEARSRAPLAILLDDSTAPVPMLNGLAARHVLFEVIYDHDVTDEVLQRFRTVAVVGPKRIRPRAAAVLEKFAKVGRVIRHTEVPDVDRLAAELREASGPAPVTVDAETVLVNYAENPRVRQAIVHVLNFGPSAVGPVKLRVTGKSGKPHLLSPDKNVGSLRVTGSGNGWMEIELSKVDVYSALVFDRI